MGNGYTMRKVGDVLIRQTAPKASADDRDKSLCNCCTCHPKLKTAIWLKVLKLKSFQFSLGKQGRRSHTGLLEDLTALDAPDFSGSKELSIPAV